MRLVLLLSFLSSVSSKYRSKELDDEVRDLTLRIQVLEEALQFKVEDFVDFSDAAETPEIDRVSWAEILEKLAFLQKRHELDYQEKRQLYEQLQAQNQESRQKDAKVR